MVSSLFVRSVIEKTRMGLPKSNTPKIRPKTRKRTWDSYTFLNCLWTSTVILMSAQSGSYDVWCDFQLLGLGRCPCILLALCVSFAFATFNFAEVLLYQSPLRCDEPNCQFAAFRCNSNSSDRAWRVSCFFIISIAFQNHKECEFRLCWIVQSSVICYRNL